MKAVLEGRHLTWQPLDKRPFYFCLLGKRVVVRLEADPDLIKGILVDVSHLPHHRNVGGAMRTLVVGTAAGRIIVRASSVLSIGEEGR